MEESENILRVLKAVKKALKNKNYVKIKNLSETVIHQSSIEQNPNIISVAVIIYSLSKLIERESYKSYKNWENFYRAYIRGIENMINALEKNNINDFKEEINQIIKLIQNLSGNLKIYIGEVFRKAKINKASRVYEQGISMEKTAKILGISLWELAEYSGRTRIGDMDLSITMPIKNRIKIVQEVFK
jgi:hypothetical protein